MAASTPASAPPFSFNVTVRKHILEDRSDDSKYALLRYELVLPFAPYLGLSLSERKWVSGRLVDVSFVVDKASFDCRAESDYAQSDDGDIDFEYMVDEAVAQGWTLVVVRTPGERLP